MRRDNRVNKTQLVLTLHSCSKLEFNAGGDGVFGREEWQARRSPPSVAGRENPVAFHLPSLLHAEPILLDC